MQPAVGDPASAGGLDWMTHRGPFQPQTSCDSVISSDALISIQFQEAKHLISSPVVYRNFHANNRQRSGIPSKVWGVLLFCCCPLQMLIEVNASG